METGETDFDLVLGAKKEKGKKKKKGNSAEVWLDISYQIVSSNCMAPNSTLDDGSWLP